MEQGSVEAIELGEKKHEVVIPVNKASTLSKSEDAIQIVFQDLNFSIMKPKKNKPMFNNDKQYFEEKAILKNVSGVFRPGRLTAIMGNSGAGKTSLLNVLAGEIDTGIVEGDIFANGEPASPDLMKKISGFVFQDDLILGTMTVREAISMSAILRLPKSISREDKAARVEEIIKILRLEKAADTIVGSAFIKGISGGERKRTAMAMDMVINPSILYLDEPTSGLDTFTAFSVVSTLSDLAKQGRTVVATIHQPSSDIFHIFDDLILLSEGCIVYQGPCDKVVDYFAARGYPCPEYTNPADYIFMHILNNSLDLDPKNPTKGAATDKIKKLIEDWKTSDEQKAILETVRNPKQGGVLALNQKEPSQFSNQFGYLATRAAKNAWRNKLIVRAKFFQTLFIALFVGLLYNNTNSSNSIAAQQQNIVGALFFMIVNTVMSNSMSILTVFSGEKPVFIREYNARYYTLSAYFFSKLGVESPAYVVFPGLLVVIVYWLIGFQNTAEKFFIQFAFIIVSSFSGMALGIFSASLFSDLTIALALVPMLLLPFIVFSGLFINNNAIPVYFNWIKFISPIKYAYTGVMQNELTGKVFSYNGRTSTGEALLQNFALNKEFPLWTNFGLLVTIVVVLMVLAYVGLYRSVAKSGKVQIKSNIKPK